MSGTGCSNSYIDALGAWTWESISPGSTVLPPRSTCWVSVPASFWMSAFVPVAVMRPSANRHRLHGAKLRIDGHDLAGVEDVARRGFALIAGRDNEREKDVGQVAVHRQSP